MKPLVLLAISIIFLFTACSEESLLHTEAVPAYYTSSEQETTRFLEQGTRPVPGDQLEGEDTTIQLQVMGSHFSSSTEELAVDYYKDHDLTGAELETIQYLDFTNAQGNPVTLSLPVDSYGDSTTYFQVTYGLGTRDITGWQVKGSQNIIVEDIVIN